MSFDVCKLLPASFFVSLNCKVPTHITMRIENDIKLGFKDVMIRPKRSTLNSRAEVTLARRFKFLHGGDS